MGLACVSMTTTIGAFVDHHAHVLAAAAGETLPEDLYGHHAQLFAERLSPRDISYPPATQQFDDVFAQALERAARYGIGLLTEAGMSHWEYWNALIRLRETNHIPLQLRIHVASGIADLSRMQKTGDPQLEITGVKFYADGWLGPRSAALFEPYSDDPTNNGFLFLDALTLARRIEPIAAAGFEIATHAIGDRAISAVLDAYDMVFGDELRKHRPRIEHVQILNETLIARIANMGVVCCIQPSFAVSDAKFVRSRIGDERMSNAYNWSRLIDAGASVIAGSDFGVEVLDPLVGLRHLATGISDSGEQVASGLDLATALSLMTDHAVGTLTLSRDPAVILTDSWRELTVTSKYMPGSLGLAP